MHLGWCACNIVLLLILTYIVSHTPQVFVCLQDSGKGVPRRLHLGRECRARLPCGELARRPKVWAREMRA